MRPGVGKEGNMAQIFRYARNRATSVTSDGPGQFTAQCRLVDTLCEMTVWVSVTLPGLEIARAWARVDRNETAPDLAPGPALARLEGARVGSGLIKIIAGVVGEDPALHEIAYMVEECCQAVILALTKRELAKAPREPEDNLPFLAKMVENNPRMVGRCVAFAPGSSYVPLAKEGEDA